MTSTKVMNLDPYYTYLLVLPAVSDGIINDEIISLLYHTLIYYNTGFKKYKTLF